MHIRRILSTAALTQGCYRKTSTNLYMHNLRKTQIRMWAAIGIFQSSSEEANMRYKDTHSYQKWHFIGMDPAKLIFDSRKELVVNVEHIIQDNKARFPAPFSGYSDYQLQLFIDGSVKAAKDRLRRNYKIAVPQYFITSGTIQLLIPLCLSSQNVADLAIVVEDYGTMYRASTCLTLDQAMNNARLLARPDRDWLNP